MDTRYKPPRGFLPINPARTRLGFETIRSVRTGASGVPYVRSGGVSRWRGSFKLPLLTPKILDIDPENDPTDPNALVARASGREVLCFFRERDNNSAFFFADLRTLDKTDEDRIHRDPDVPRWQLPHPKWNDISIPSPLYFELEDNTKLSEVDPGDIISFREVAGADIEMQDYVTARVVIRKEGSKIFIDRPLPQGMVPEYDHITKQACWNRPHVRALMTNPPAIWQSIHIYLDMPAIEWVEDLVEVSEIYREAANRDVLFLNLNSESDPKYFDLGGDQGLLAL